MPATPEETLDRLRTHLRRVARSDFLFAPVDDLKRYHALYLAIARESRSDRDAITHALALAASAHLRRRIPAARAWYDALQSQTSAE
jgi:hypothetical protein